MKQFKITKDNKDYIINASNNVEAVKKLRDSKLKDTSTTIKERNGFRLTKEVWSEGGKAYVSYVIIDGNGNRWGSYDGDEKEVALKEFETISQKVRDRTYVKPTGGWFYGIYGMEFIWNGTQSDPYIRYKGRVVNYYDVEDALYEDYKEDVKYNGYKGEFEKWVKENASMAKYYAENAPQVRVKDSKDEEVSVEEQTEEIQDAAGNFSKLKGGSRNCKLFASTVESLSHSQGFYGRLIRDIENMDEDEFAQLVESINGQNFKEPLDVVLWLEG